MGLAASLADARPKHTTDKCKLRAWSATLDDPADVAALWTLLASDDVPLREAARILTTNGYPVSTSTIANHRRGECLTCERYRPWA